jgi:hypothetical protein
MDEYWLSQAREAADEIRAGGRAPAIPLADAFYLDHPTARLLEALVGLGILTLSEVEALDPAALSPQRPSAA